jgi:hypothetical protein
MTKTINHSNLKGIVRFWHKYRRNEQSRPDVEFPYYICKGENGGFTLHQIKKKIKPSSEVSESRPSNSLFCSC